MGYVTAMSPCIGCGNVFIYNPVRVPSCSAVTGKREPICQVCVDRVNPMRIKNGLEPIVPHHDAYLACEEGELG
jgi:Fe-S-cluster-containing dehydrogenase component